MGFSDQYFQLPADDSDSATRAARPQPKPHPPPCPRILAPRPTHRHPPAEERTTFRIVLLLQEGKG
jgi:hypothetical protein